MLKYTFSGGHAKNPTMLYPRDPSLDPQLVWKGKDEQDRGDLAVPAVPIYIQEKIHPQAIIDDLPPHRRTRATTSLDLFADFNGVRTTLTRKSSSTSTSRLDRTA